ncbi:MAG: hypothetical protein KJ067_03405 [Vicinamibacteria bacterium]|nr:hypothetical protein [Vicinamibacteria bacterium]
MTKRAQWIEVVPDAGLRAQEAQATAAFRRFFPKAPALKLYRTSDGRVGFQAQMLLAAGDKARLEQAYAAVMKVLGQRRGRPGGERKVQAKLRLHEPVYRALQEAAQSSHTTLSAVVEDLARKAHLV